MSGSRIATVAAGALALALTLASCERARSAAPSGNGATSTAAPPSSDALAGWADADMGPVLFVAGSNETDAALVFPHYTDSTLGTVSALDTGVVSQARADLFARGGAVGAASIVPTSAGVLGGDCTAWPSGRVRALDRTAGGVPGPWTVGFVAGHATAIAMDSVPMLSPADSARRAAEITRLAAALPNDTAVSFRGVPYEIQHANRFPVAPGIDALVAVLVRHLNEEASPREEHILLIAERDSAHPPAAGPVSYVAAYSERASGSEDDVESSDALAAVRLGPGRAPSLVVGRDYGDGGAYTLIERAGPGHWRVRWNSAYTGC